MKRSSLLSIAAASLLGSAALMPAVHPALRKGLGGGYRRQRYPNGPGWTHAQVQRMARKRRNQSSNRRAQRRAGSK